MICKRTLSNKGFTLIELIIFIIIGAIFLPASFVAFTSVMNNYSRSDYYVKARFYADKRMAEITNNPYDSIAPNVPIPPTGLSCSATFPPTTFTADAGYTTGCVIESINPDLSTTNPNPNYKRITVTVRYSGLLSDYIIKTIVTRRPNLP